MLLRTYFKQDLELEPFHMQIPPNFVSFIRFENHLNQIDVFKPPLELEILQMLFFPSFTALFRIRIHLNEVLFGSKFIELTEDLLLSA